VYQIFDVNFSLTQNFRELNKSDKFVLSLYDEPVIAPQSRRIISMRKVAFGAEITMFVRL